MSRVIAVDSPPGMIRPVEPVELLGLAHLDGLGAEPRAASRRASRKFPCGARTPIVQRLGHLLDSGLATLFRSGIRA